MKNDPVFELKFDPPLNSGELVNYGFYVWNKNHYSRSGKEALERYEDEWTREGLAILDPAPQFGIRVELSERYKYPGAILEKDPILAMGGPNVPAAVLSRFDGSGKFLDFDLEHLPLGHHFVGWIPPD